MMKWLNIAILLFTVSCASVDKGKSDDYQKMISELRNGELEKAIEVIKKSRYESFDFYVITDKYDKAVKFTEVDKGIVLGGLRKIKESLDNCKGNNSCYEDLGWPSQRYFANGYNKFNLGTEHFHKKYKVSIFDGAVNGEGAQWQSHRIFNTSQMLINYKERTDRAIKLAKEKRQSKQNDNLRKLQKNKMQSPKFRKCLVNYLLDYEDHNRKVINKNFENLKLTSLYQKNKNLNDKLYSDSVNTSSRKSKQYNSLIAKEGSINDSECNQEFKLIQKYRFDFEQKLKGFYDIH